MDRYALDTNAIREDFRFRRNPWRLFLREGRLGHLKILVPEIVVDEAVNLYREDAANALRSATKARRSLLGLGADQTGVPPVELDVEALTDAYAARLREALESAKADFLPYPRVSHEDVVRRALDRRRPFDSEGKDGYRDTVVWETLLNAVVATDPIMLITADNAAFSSKGSTALIPALADELEARDLPRDTIRRATRISDITDLLPSVPELQLGAEHLIATNAGARQFIVNALTEDALDYGESATSIIGLNLDIDQFYISWIDEVTDIEVESARELDDGKAALDLSAKMDATLEAYVRKGDAYGYDGDDLHITDYDYNESMAEGFVLRMLEAGFEAVYDPESEQITNVRAYSYIPMGPHRSTGT
jgi:hypothetical protein